MADFKMSADERKTILEAYENLRVTDVCDGMDWVSLFDVGWCHLAFVHYGEPRRWALLKRRGTLQLCAGFPR